jgi:hypothetical protein
MFLDTLRLNNFRSFHGEQIYFGKDLTILVRKKRYPCYRLLSLSCKYGASSRRPSQNLLGDIVLAVLRPCEFCARCDISTDISLADGLMGIESMTSSKPWNGSNRRL